MFCALSRRYRRPLTRAQWRRNKAQHTLSPHRYAAPEHRRGLSDLKTEAEKGFVPSEGIKTCIAAFLPPHPSTEKVSYKNLAAEKAD